MLGSLMEKILPAKLPEKSASDAKAVKIEKRLLFRRKCEGEIK
jgi:hypothetical protein